MTVFVRGSAITFRATCKDQHGDPITPDSATLHLSYVEAATGKRVADSATMDIEGDTVSVVWDSSVASDGMPVVWHIRAAPVAQDGAFTLTAAEANPVAS